MDFTGAGFNSKSKYMFGKVTVQIKLVEGDSAGTVTAFYVSLLVQILDSFNNFPLFKGPISPTAFCFYLVT